MDNLGLHHAVTRETFENEGKTGHWFFSEIYLVLQKLDEVATPVKN